MQNANHFSTIFHLKQIRLRLKKKQGTFYSDTFSIKLEFSILHKETHFCNEKNK